VLHLLRRRYTVFAHVILNFGILYLWLYYRQVDHKLSRNFLVNPSWRQVGHPCNRRLAHTAHTFATQHKIHKAAYQQYKSSLLFPVHQKNIYDKVTRIIIDCDVCSTFWQSFSFFVTIRKHYQHLCNILNHSPGNFIIEIKQISWSCPDAFFPKINIQIQSWSEKITGYLILILAILTSGNYRSAWHDATRIKRRGYPSHGSDLIAYKGLGLRFKTLGF